MRLMTHKKFLVKEIKSSNSLIEIFPSIILIEFNFS